MTLSHKAPKCQEVETDSVQKAGKVNTCSGEEKDSKTSK